MKYYRSTSRNYENEKLGDKIIFYSQFQSPRVMAIQPWDECNREFIEFLGVEIEEGIDRDALLPFPDNIMCWKSEIALDKGDKVIQIPLNNMKPVEEFKHKTYWTYQLNDSLHTDDEYNQVRALSDKSKQRLMETYKGEKVDIGHKQYSLAETAWLCRNARGHFGVDSGMGWLALASGQKNVYIYRTRKAKKGHNLWHWSNNWRNAGVKLKYINL